MAPGRPSNLRVSSTLPPDHTDYRVDDTQALAALSRAEDEHFWHRARNEFIVARLKALGCGPRLIELGCGGGVVVKALSTAGFTVVGVDGHVARLTEAARRAPTAEFIAHDLSRGPAPVEQGAFDAVAFFDVIEHLDAPRPVLEEALELLRPGGLLVGTVPALMGLWSRVDERSGHKRRYSRATLTATLAQVAGARLVEVVDFNRHLVPLTWLQRRWLERTRHDDAVLAEGLAVPSAPVNGSLLVASHVERRLEPLLRHLPLPGASLWFALERGAASS
jgi:2-polyprenyl-3-methyl-5-hydroxy-6-metoxy-1,4-benzoquinol methylase